MNKELELLRKRKFSKTVIEEKFDIHNDPLFAKAVAAVYKSEEIDCSERIAEIKEMIAKGEYNPSIDAISQKILEHMS